MLPISIPLSLRADRTIAVTRILLAVVSLLAVWVDPAESARFVELTYGMLVLYVAYAVSIAAILWSRPSARAAVATHVFDIGAFSVFQYLTLGPASPFFAYFVFSLFCATIRWGWRGTLWTAAVVLFSFFVMGLSMSQTLGATEFELNRFIIRLVYLAVTAVLLVYLSRHEATLREQIGRLARWPPLAGLDMQTATAEALRSAAEIVGTGRVVAVWEGDEPWSFHASWQDGAATFAREFASSPLLRGVPRGLEDATFISRGLADNGGILVLKPDGGVQNWGGPRLDAELLALIGHATVLSTPFASDRVAGRMFFSQFSQSPVELGPIACVVAREMAASLEQLQLSERQREVAVGHERIRLARDLHDGVLQSLTGIRLELQAAAAELPTAEAPGGGRRLLGLERALAVEQRELRLFIEGLKPFVRRAPSSETLADRLLAMKQRIALQWSVPVSIHVRDTPVRLSSEACHAIPLMVHEAIVNALKHAAPSHVTVRVRIEDNHVQIVVQDDGRGFPFRGRYDHTTLARTSSGPASLRDRVSSLGGSLSVESTANGSRVEFLVPIAAEVECPSA